MVDPTPMLADIDAAIKTVPGVTVYDGYVPDKVPLDSAGFVLPYIVEWFGVGDNADEPNLISVYDTDGLILDFQTSVVAATPALCRAVTKQVKTALTNLRVGTGRVKPNPDGFNQQAPIRDTNVNPHRFYLPQQWRLLTN